MSKPNQLQQHPCCGAKTRQGGTCQQPAMKNGRCRLHGGKSTGPRTPKGLERSRYARWKHGNRSAATVARKRANRDFLRAAMAMLIGKKDINSDEDDASIIAAYAALMRCEALELRT